MPKYPLPILFLLICYTLTGQDNYQDRLTSFIDEQKQEKVYLHLDKPNYGIGEEIWFKAYIINSTYHTPTNTSSTLYVDLINSAEEVVDSLMLLISDGTAKGNFKVSRKLVEGTYRVRAYTNWMRNSDSEFFFNKDIQILRAKSSNDTTRVENNEILVNFFPEGGDLIDGIPTKVAIKITDPLGKGILSEGQITDSNGGETATFKTNEFGHALVFLNPKSGIDYLVTIGSKKYRLPGIKSEGATLRVNHSPNLDMITISALSKNLDLKGATIVGHQRGHFLFSGVSNKSNSFSIKIDKKNLDPGIVHITLFRKNNIPVSERLIFPSINPESKLSINANAEEYDKRSKAEISFQLRNDSIHSASVTINHKGETNYSEHHDNIVNYLLLDSDLKGKIESPHYYFGGSDEIYNDRDLLMLTHGWSRFNWQSVLEEEVFQPEFFAESGPVINGQVVDYFKTEKPRQAKFSLTILTMGIFDMEGETNENGEFSIETPHFSDSTYILVKAEGFKKKKGQMDKWVQIKLLNTEKPQLDDLVMNTTFSNPLFETKIEKLDQITKAFSLDQEATLLDEVVISVKNPVQQEYEKRTKMYKNPSNRIILDSVKFGNTFANTPLDLLREVPGVRIVGTGLNQTATIRGSTSINGNNGPLYLIDGVPVESSVILTYPVEMIEFIDVLKGPATSIYGSRGAGGVVLIYTRRGTSRYKNEPPKGVLAFKHPGYSKTKEFFSPNYESPKEEHAIPDYRSTLYWEPNLQFKNGQASLEFYTSDQAGVYNIRIEGMLKDGRPFFSQSELIVE